MVRIVQLYDGIAGKANGVIPKVLELAKIAPLPAIIPDADSIEAIDNADLDRVDASGLSVESLIYLLQRAQQISATEAEKNFATQLLKVEVTEEQRPAKLVAYMSLINAAGSAIKALEYLEEAKKFAEANKISDASLLLSEISLRLQSGDGEGFQNALQTLSTRHGQDPEVMAQLQQMLISYGLLRPDGSPRQAAPAPAGALAGGAADDSSSGLWTPESGSPNPASGSEAAKKLWVPGMD
jgi:hypothetical protein